MVEQLQTVATANTTPYKNIALEKLLLDSVQPGQCILYLWQNAKTVVIGRNQSALGECRVGELQAAGGRLARRLSGGGAVYHDLGNLNFTFLARREDYDVARQTEVILEAVKRLGIPAERTGRNDLTVDGGKFSGHAYYRTGGACYHHGTLMVQVDVEDMGRYLKPAPDKLASKGVQSVRSRVANLSDHRPGLTIAELAESLCAAFGSTFGLPVERRDAADFEGPELDALTRRFGSDEWLFRDDRDLGRASSGRFDWGGITLRYELAGGVMDECLINSDGLEADYLEKVPSLLSGCAFEPAAVEAALLAGSNEPETDVVARDIVRLLFPEGAGMGAGAVSSPSATSPSASS